MPWSELSPLAAALGTATGYMQGRKQRQDEEYQRQQDAVKNAIAQTSAQGLADERRALAGLNQAKAGQTIAMTPVDVELGKARSQLMHAQAQAAIDKAADDKLRELSQSQHWQHLDANARQRLALDAQRIKQHWKEAVAKNQVSVQVAQIHAAAQIEAAAEHAGATMGAAQIRATASQQILPIIMKAWAGNAFKPPPSKTGKPPSFQSRLEKFMKMQPDQQTQAVNSGYFTPDELQQVLQGQGTKP